MGIKYLFFDLSRNRGGYYRGFDYFWPYINWKKGATYSVEVTAKEDGRIENRWESLNFDNKRPKIKGAKPFKGDVFIYQSYYTTSAAPDFCATMKALAGAVLVGTETNDGIPGYGYTSNTFYLKYSGVAATMSTRFFKSESPQLPRTKEGRLLPDIAYPFLKDRRLSVEDCKKIIELNKQRKLICTD